MIHIPVLLKEVIEYLSPQPNENFIDATIGSGGQAFAILDKTSPQGKILGIDLNSDALHELKFKLQSSRFKSRLILVNDNFANLSRIVKKYNFQPVNGIIIDLGLSSDLLETSGRGFSFKRNEFLDMRFGQSQNKMTAYEIISQLPHFELERIFKDYGEEKFAKAIAFGITRNRRRQKIKTTLDLVNVINQSIPPEFSRKGRIKIYARIFQALRIVVNDELNNLRKVLDDGIKILNSRGRIAVISFHSLEDRIVKEFFRQKEKEKIIKILTNKPIFPSSEEIKSNPRSHSAKLRVAVKT